MPRSRVYPRLVAKDGNEYLVLIHDNPVRGIDMNLSKDPIEVFRRLVELAEAMRDFFKMETRQELFVFPSENGWEWCVYDTLKNVRGYLWLQKKAIKLSRGISMLVQRELENEGGYTRRSTSRLSP